MTGTDNADRATAASLQLRTPGHRGMSPFMNTDFSRFSDSFPAGPARVPISSFFLAVALSLPLATGVLVVPVATHAQSADPADAPVQRVQNIQDMLTNLGYDPGPADGVAGARTVGAIIAFQRSAGLAQTGQPDAVVYRALVKRLAAATKPAAAPPAKSTTAQTAPTKPAAVRSTPVRSTPAAASIIHTAAAKAQAPASGKPAKTAQVSAATPSSAPPAKNTKAQAVAAPPPAIAGIWAVTDSNGSRQTVRLNAKGTVGDVATPEFWKWRLEDIGSVQIEYDNGLGGWVHRTGHITDKDHMEGTAISSRGHKWTWSADRLHPTK